MREEKTGIESYRRRGLNGVCFWLKPENQFENALIPFHHQFRKVSPETIRLVFHRFTGQSLNLVVLHQLIPPTVRSYSRNRNDYADGIFVTCIPETVTEPARVSKRMRKEVERLEDRLKRAGEKNPKTD